MRTLQEIKRDNSYDEPYLLLTDGTKIRAVHDQDCCEHVYADFESIRDIIPDTWDLTNLEVEVVPESGFRLNGVFVPCYNEQNGYYSDELTLEISRNGTLLESHRLIPKEDIY